MQIDNEIIEGGCILLSRQILTSEIWRKPPEYLKIFLYILLKVNHKDGLFPRGSNFFNFTEERPHGVTLTQVYEFLRWAKSEKVQFCTTEKTTRGVVINVNNYGHYQNLLNYKNQDGNQDSSNTAPRQLQDSSNTINNNVIMKECNNVISIDEKKPKEKPKRTKKDFIPPTLEEVKKYCLEERKNNVDYQRFFDYYNVSDWKDRDGKPLKNWKQKIIAVWERSSGGNKPAPQKKSENEDFYMSLSRR